MISKDADAIYSGLDIVLSESSVLRDRPMCAVVEYEYVCVFHQRHTVKLFQTSLR
ncbi:MAG: hypothetical protein IM597_12410 [Pseudanabaena sp. M176S2SP2A07QC]|nr:hypothetical protein [Pseudanabaena sp. M176S2SP2A07QC]MCA6622032.1 hypothetical protein [Pseudanabaena sp. M165S2SP1A06QC]